MRDSIRLLTIRGIQLRVHLTFPLILIWAMLQFGLFTGLGWEGALFGVIVILLLFGIVVLHELGHSIAAQNYGIDVEEIVLLPIGGVALLKRIPEKPMQEFVIAIAGPAVNFALAGVLLVLDALFGLAGRYADPVQGLGDLQTLSVASVFNYVFVANLFLAFFNLIPAFPMDGGRILRALLATRLNYARATGIAVAIGQTLAWIIGLWGFLNGAFFVILVAIFIYIGAGQENQQVQIRHVLRDLTVRHAYSRRVRVLSPTTTLAEAVEHVVTGFQSDFPVCEGDHLEGLVTYRNLIDGLSKHAPTTAVSAVMTTNLKPLAPEDALDHAQQEMMRQGVDVLPVVEGKHFKGLLTSRDVSEVYRVASIQPDLLPKLRETGVSLEPQR
ncbi:site-2 protease family protein [Aggregatilineales bacterium SYSU G02658]